MALPPERYVHPEDVERLNRDFASLSPERPRLTGQYRLRHKDGATVRVEAIFQLTDFDALGPASSSRRAISRRGISPKRA